MHKETIGLRVLAFIVMYQRAQKLFLEMSVFLHTLFRYLHIVLKTNCDTLKYILRKSDVEAHVVIKNHHI